MPAQKGKSALAAKYGNKLKEAHEQHKADETKLMGGGDLPAGIENGIAQVVDCKFDVYKEGDFKGEYFFYGRAIVIEPKEIGGIPIEGLSTQIGPEPICDTPKRTRKTTADHISWVLNQFRLLGVETKGLSPDAYEVTAEAIKQASPHIRFRTWKGKKQETGEYAGQEPRVQHDWRGVVKFDAATGTAEGAVEDATGDVAPGEEPWNKDAAAEGGAPPSSPTTATSAPETDDDLDALAKIADEEQDADAMRKIEGQCKLFNIDSAAEETWADAVAKLKEAMAKEPSASAAKTEEAEFVPQETEVHYYRPLDPKTKQKVAKAVECEVTKVFPSAKKCNLKNLEDGKTSYKSVPFSELEQG